VLKREEKRVAVRLVTLGRSRRKRRRMAVVGETRIDTHALGKDRAHRRTSVQSSPIGWCSDVSTASTRAHMHNCKLARKCPLLAFVARGASWWGSLCQFAYKKALSPAAGWGCFLMQLGLPQHMATL
jgi:hypothetical protein